MSKIPKQSQDEYKKSWLFEEILKRESMESMDDVVNDGSFNPTSPYTSPPPPARVGLEPIDQALAHYGLASHDVGAFGDCQFRALAHHLGTTHEVARARVVAELRLHPDRYCFFAEQWDVPGSGEERYGRSYWDFVADMECQGVWGGNATLQAAANAYGRTLHVVSAPAPGSTYYTEVVPASPASQADGGDDVWLAYLDGNHYRATRLLDGYAEASSYLSEEKVGFTCNGVSRFLILNLSQPL